MREETVLAVPHSPYGLEVHVIEGGLLLKPRRKAREGWARLLKKIARERDDLGEVRAVRNEFDEKGWEW